MDEKFPKAKDKNRNILYGSKRRVIQKRMNVNSFEEISCENADMFSSVNNFIKLYRMPKGFWVIFVIPGLNVPYLF